jgi:hypothetical protein
MTRNTFLGSGAMGALAISVASAVSADIDDGGQPFVTGSMVRSDGAQAIRGRRGRRIRHPVLHLLRSHDDRRPVRPHLNTWHPPPHRRAADRTPADQ